MPESGITLREAAEYLGCGYETLWFLVRHGQLQAAIRASEDWRDGMIVTYGRIWRIRPAAMVWIAHNGLPAIDRAAVGDDE